MDDNRSKAEEFQRRVRELEEQIESDDHAERLEATLQHTQDRAAELELQVSKLKQVSPQLRTPGVPYFYVYGSMFSFFFFLISNESGTGY